MTRRDILTTYRAAVLELQELGRQLDHIGRSGAPRGALSMCTDAAPGTNNPAAAALQAAEGIERMMERKRAELAELAIPVGEMMARIGSSRTFMVIQRYYIEADTDANIARAMQMSRCRVNQLRNAYLDEGSGQTAAGYAPAAGMRGTAPTPVSIH